VVQRIELANARRPDYTVPEAIDFEGARNDNIDGAEEILPQVWVIPTAGHTTGHQSLVVECSDGTVVCAGQTHSFAHEYGSELLATRAERESAISDLPERPAWFERIQDFDPRRIVFAHDLAVLEL